MNNYKKKSSIFYGWNVLFFLSLFNLTAMPVVAQVVLPPPVENFSGKIGKDYTDSKGAFPKLAASSQDAPNVVLVLTDDVGFGAASTFGGPIPTPNLDRLAADGLKYNRFHTTAMCSPTRAALLTGRNHHAVNSGIVANLATGFPGYNNLLPKSAATVAEVLRQNGYNTAMFGKHHNTPENQVSAAGPFDLWPTGLGFEYFYGFMGAQTNQFTPALYRGTTPIPTLKEGVLDVALADEAIGWLHQQKSAAPDKPFFIYLSTGTAHAPLQAPAEWIAKFKGDFDKGYDQIRAETVERQKALGIIPANTVSTSRPEEIPAWEDTTPEQKQISARLMEVYAGMLSHQDAQFGRLLDEIERMGQRENTLVIFIQGDNGAAAEAGMHGGLNPMARFANGFVESDQVLLENLDKMGGPDASPNYGYGWTWAANAPFKMAKQFASHLGGTRNGMVVSWPKGIEARGVRSQYSHVIDIAPTILDVAGIQSPQSVNGVEQQPVDGISLAYSFASPEALEQRKTQYFEMMGNRAIYHDGWLASSTPPSAPWSKQPTSALPSDYEWELYDLRADFAQGNDIASLHPEKLTQLQELFSEEAARNQVFPLDNRMTIARFLESSGEKKKLSKYTYWGKGVSMPVARAAPILNKSFTITAELEVPDKANGVVVALGSKFGGWSFFLKDGKPIVIMAASQLEADHSRVAAKKALSSGKALLKYQFVYDGGVNAGGDMVISLDGEEIGRGRIDKTISQYPEITDTIDVGFDRSTLVNNEYAGRDLFSGKIKRVDIELD